MSARRRADDRGSVLLLTVGLVLVALLAIAVAVDVSAAFLQRRGLAATADAAALAGAQVVDLDAYYARGRRAGDPIPLDRGAVRGAVLAHLRSAGAWADHPGLVVEAVTSDGETVTVRLRAPLRTPFAGVGGRGDVRAEAAARLALVPAR